MQIVELFTIIAFVIHWSNCFYVDHKDGANKIIELPIRRRAYLRGDVQWNASRKRSRRSLPTVLANQPNGFYTTEITLGTPLNKGGPLQHFILNVDTGSSNIWVNTKTTTHCSKSPDDCKQYGTYDPQKSATCKPIENSEFSIKYSDTSTVSGTSVTDRLGIGGKYLADIQFGVADTSSSGLGVIGLGYASNEWGTPTSPTLSEALLNQGLIKLNAYSVWLNEINAEAGSVVYGGVDKSKYSRLTILPVQQMNTPGTNPYRELVVNLNKASYLGKKSPAVVALLDTGTEYLQLPGKFVRDIYKAMKAVPDEKNDYYVDCSLANSKETMDFEFGTDPEIVLIQVPLSSLVYQPYQSRLVPSNANGDPLCSLSLAQANSNDIAVLGSPFLRSAYAVFDLTNNQISIGQAMYTSASNIVEIPANGVGAMKGVKTRARILMDLIPESESDLALESESDLAPELESDLAPEFESMDY